MCDFVYDTKHGYMVSGILLKIWVYDTKMYDTKGKTAKTVNWGARASGGGPVGSGGASVYNKQ